MQQLQVQETMDSMVKSVDGQNIWKMQGIMFWCSASCFEDSQSHPKSFSVAFVSQLSAARFPHAGNITSSRRRLPAKWTLRFTYSTHYSKESLEEQLWGFLAPQIFKFWDTYLLISPLYRPLRIRNLNRKIKCLRISQYSVLDVVGRYKDEKALENKTGYQQVCYRGNLEIGISAYVMGTDKVCQSICLEGQEASLESEALEDRLCRRGSEVEARKEIGRGACQLNLLLQKWKENQKMQQEMINLQTKGKGGAKEKQVKMSSPETTDDLPAENGVTTNKEGPASDKAGEKKAECDYILYHVLPMEATFMNKSFTPDDLEDWKTVSMPKIVSSLEQVEKKLLRGWSGIKLSAGSLAMEEMGKSAVEVQRPIKTAWNFWCAFFTYFQGAISSMRNKEGGEERKKGKQEGRKQEGMKEDRERNYLKLNNPATAIALQVIGHAERRVTGGAVDFRLRKEIMSL
ncbi:hypothetical protein PANDA_001950 [Ailuropoda melanoleuca]|uniref:Uncharacterized protein n=1 Tax=Ailuropoda melanoleuca TaxID=9646 RepID=D2GY98_AILME|nr:hypothetical protein PANDA_001950 [Ailuropoda melanoleuca]